MRVQTTPYLHPHLNKSLQDSHSKTFMCYNLNMKEDFLRLYWVSFYFKYLRIHKRWSKLLATDMLNDICLMKAWVTDAHDDELRVFPDDQWFHCLFRRYINCWWQFWVEREKGLIVEENLVKLVRRSTTDHLNHDIMVTQNHNLHPSVCLLILCKICEVKWQIQHIK